MSRELLARALDALGTSTWDHTRAVGKQELITALRAALAQPEPEPVAWVDPRNIASAKVSQDRGGPFDAHVWSEGKTAIHTEPLYATPPAAPAPAPKCDYPECTKQCGASTGYCHKPRNAAPAPAEPPPIDNRFVAPGCEQFGTRADAESLLTMLRATLDEYMRLAAAPAVREPLTDEQIDALWSSPMSADWEHREFARAIEAHHGIGGGGK